MQTPPPIPPPLPPAQVALIEESYTRALPLKAALSERVYHHLFALEPGVRAHFPPDLAVQRAKIVAALSIIVRSLASDADLARVAEGLARSHLRYDLTERQFSHMGQAFLRAFADCLGPDFTAPMRASWQAAFDRLVPMVVAAQARLDGAA